MALHNIRLAQLPDHVGETVTTHAWVTHVRSSGKIAFAVLRDGSGVAQAVFVKSEIAAEVWAAFQELTLETAIQVTGVVRAEPRAPGGIDIGIREVKIIGRSDLDYPIQPKEH